MKKVRRFSYLKPGRLILVPKQGLRARSVRLLKGARMDWHSTGEREELLLVIAGSVVVSVKYLAKSGRRIPLCFGEGIFLPKATMHTVMNKSGKMTTYLYITGRA